MQCEPLLVFRAAQRLRKSKELVLRCVAVAVGVDRIYWLIRRVAFCFSCSVARRSTLFTLSFLLPIYRTVPNTEKTAVTDPL